MAKLVHVEERVPVPENVEVKIDGMKVTVKGSKGELTKDFSHAKGIIIRLEEGKEGKEVIVETYFANRRKKALVGTIAAHIENMIIGVTKGYRYRLKVVYSHFPVTVKVEGDKVVIENFLGEKAPRIAKIFGDVKIKVQKDEVIVEGIDIEAVGQTAANIELATKVKGFDRRVFVDGIYIYKKEFMEE
ncbi:MAG TPA: 50S ribosomal protein L6 [Pyrodictiaceae archaeon]|nr:50S ribosomal protein L6 [Pyrodictiaceae archaeon]